MFADDFMNLFNGGSDDPLKDGMALAKQYRQEMPMYMHVLTMMVKERMFKDGVDGDALTREMQTIENPGPADAFKMLSMINMEVFARFNALMLSRDPVQQEKDALLWIEEMELEEEIDGA